MGNRLCPPPTLADGVRSPLLLQQGDGAFQTLAIFAWGHLGAWTTPFGWMKRSRVGRRELMNYA